MSKRVISLFPTEQHATAAVSHLEQAGIPRSGIDLWSTPHNLAPLLQDDGVSRSDAYAYAEGVVRGGSVVIVTCSATQVDPVITILNREGALDLDEQRALWRSETGLEPTVIVSDGDLAGTLNSDEVDQLPRSTGLGSVDIR